jgi:hypothetical protein
MEAPLLRDPDIPPSDEVLKSVLRASYSAYVEMIKTITGPEYGLTLQWNFYRDGKAWLCKVSYKKKTVFWLSVWEGYFKTAFYFVERHCPGVLELDIDESIKEDLKSCKPFGTLYPVRFSIRNREQIGDLLKVVEYKKSLK